MKTATRLVDCFQDDQRARLFAERELRVSIADPMIGLVVVDKGAIVGAVILNDYTPERNIEVTAVGHCWSVKVIRFILRYCFARVRRVTARTSIHNKPAIRALEAMGFKREGIMREFFDDGDAIVFGLLRSEQKVVKV
jgi:RimJ/RimL family protein N-acetyltransferase